MTKPITIELIIIVLLSLIYVAVSSNAADVNAQVTITDTDPNGLKIVECVFAGTAQAVSYTPSAATDYKVNCTVTAYDDNGYADINKVWAWWFNGTTAANCDTTGELDTDTCYNETSCAAISGTGSGTSQSYECNFGNVKYYADQGTWTFVFLANDTNGGSNATNTTTRTINSLKSLNCSATVSFGSRTPGTVVAASVDLYVENQGNNDFTVTVQGNGDMSCTSGSIAVGKIKYDLTDSTAYVDAAGALSAADAWGDGTCTVIDKESDHSGFQYTTGTFWGINVTEGVSGTCNNTVTFTAN